MNRIPKIIHYCWLSDNPDDPFPELIQKCVSSWREKLPEYEIKKWSTHNFDVNKCQYTKEAYKAKKYAFVSDYVRLYALYTEGGIYLDSDVEVIKSFDDLLNEHGFTCFENNHSVATCIFGSEKGNPLFKEFMEYYTDRAFVLPNGEYDLTPNPVPITNTCVEKGLILNGQAQFLENISIYTQDYFCPYNRATEEVNITDNTHCIHYFNGAWIPDKKKIIIETRKKVIRKYGKVAGYIYYGMKIIRTEGINQFLKELKFFIK